MGLIGGGGDVYVTNPDEKGLRVEEVEERLVNLKKPLFHFLMQR